MPGTAPSALRDRRQAIVQQHIDAENQRDLDALITSFHRPRYEVFPMGAVSDGDPAVRELVNGLFAGFPDFNLAPTAFHHAATAVIVEGQMTGTHRGEWVGLPPKGAKLDVRSPASSSSTTTDSSMRRYSSTSRRCNGSSRGPDCSLALSVDMDLQLPSVGGSLWGAL